jgi:hypothetical protein
MSCTSSHRFRTTRRIRLAGGWRQPTDARNAVDFFREVAGAANEETSHRILPRARRAATDKTVGPAAFRAILGGFYQKYKIAGATTQDFIAFASERGGPPVRALLADWMTSTRWTVLLSAGRSLEHLAASYRAVATKP